MIPLIVGTHLLDLLAALLVTSAYGLAVEANPAMKAALELGPLGGLALKAALLALIFAAAAMNRRWRWALLAATLVVGLVGAASGVLAWSA